MPNRIVEDVVYTTSKFIENSFEYPLEQEILLADYDRPIFKIIRTYAQHTITQKYINANKLIIEGFFRITVFYQPPQGANLTVVTKKLPFSKQLDLADNITGPYFVNVTGSRRYINTRAVNPTRVDIRGVYNFGVTGFCKKRLSFATAVAGGSVCTDTEEITCFALEGRGNRRFSVEQEINLDGKTEKILDITAKNNTMSLTAYNDKVNIKGDITAEIIYTAEDNKGLNKYRKTFSYNQVVDVPGCRENSACYGDFHLTSFTVTQNPDSRGINCIMTADLDVQAFRKLAVICAADGFSTGYEYNCSREALEFDSNLITINKTMSVMLEDTVPRDYEVCHCFATVTPPVVAAGESGHVLKSKVSVNVIVKNSGGEYDCFTKTEDVYFSTGGEINRDNQYVITPDIKECIARINDNSMRVKVDIGLAGFEIVRGSTNTITYFEEFTDKPLDNTDNALVLYYGEKGEKLFDIAHRYKTDVKAVMAENSLEGKTLTRDKMLFIPAYGM